MFFMRRTLQIMKTKSRLVQNYQIQLSKEIIVKQNFRYSTNLNMDRYLDRNTKEIEIRNEVSHQTKKDFIYEFNSELDWEDSIMNSIIPVVVNFFADWYAPCRQLMTIFLSKMKLQKNFKLVKLNIEKNQDIVENMGIDSVPTIFLVFKGKIVDSIVGYPDEERLNEFFCSITSLVETDNEETSVNELLKEANDHMRKKEWQLAEDKLNKSYNFEKSKEKYGPSVKYAYCMYRKNDLDLAQKSIRELYDKFSFEIKNDKVLKRKIISLEKKIKNRKNPYLQQSKFCNNKTIEYSRQNEDLHSKFYLALQYFEHSDFEKAINTLLDILKIDTNWNDKKALNLLLKIFNFLGSNNKISIEGKKSLFAVLL